MSAITPSMVLPPAYSSDSLDALSSESEELPTYTGQSTPPLVTQTGRNLHKEFTAEISRQGKAWAVLTMLADGALSASIPTILEGSDITGSVKLNLDKENGIHSVIVCVKGCIMTGSHSEEKLTFLECTKTLWSQSGIDSEGMVLDDHGQSKLLGDHFWPFTISLPKEVVLPTASRGSTEIFRLPQTFLQRQYRVSIQYEVNLLLARGKLRSDYGTNIVFGFIPIIKPSPPSPLRQLAYQENSPLLGPNSDPDGWRTLHSVRVRGIIFNARAVDVKCTLSLAMPLCYTRGSAIPCHIALETTDFQALELLSSPKSIVMRLRRRIKMHNIGPTVDLYGWDDAIDDSELAAWWPSTEGIPDETSPKREIIGELHLPIDTKPTSAMAQFRIEYSVVLLPFETTGFVSEVTEPLCTVPIEVATAFAAGPRPRTYTPSGYEAHHTLVPSEHFIVPYPSPWL